MSALRKHRPDTLSIVIFAAVLLLVNAGARTGAGWVWDFANGLGFAAMAGFIYLCTQHAARVPVRYHQTFSYIVLLLVLLHTALLLATDRIVLDYLKPGAPPYMWAGLLSLLLLGFLIISARPGGRKQVFLNHPHFRHWHRALSWLAIAAALFHIIGSAFYLRNVFQYAGMALLSMAVFLPGPFVERFHVRGYSAIGFAMLGLCLAAVLSISRNVLQP